MKQGGMAWARWAIAALALLVSLPAAALEPATTGVVLVHGKWGHTRGLQSLAETLGQAGFLVERPEMPWSGSRLFDRGFEVGLDEIDAAAERLRVRGAVRIVVAGHSLGGDAALAYASRAPVAALVLFAPAHFPEGKFFRDNAGDSVAKARAMVAAGQGDDTGSFLSLNDGNRTRMVQARARDYLSYYDPEGAAAMSRFAPRVKPVPILWLAPSQDRTGEVFGRLVLPLLPPGTPVERMDIPGAHVDAPDTGRSKARDWLMALPGG